MTADNDLFSLLKNQICARLQIEKSQYIEIESKKRVLPEQAKKLLRYLLKRKKIEHVKTSLSLDQFLDTPNMDIFKIGASLRLRYKKNGSEVYLQYKGPGFMEGGLLYRSEFSSNKLRYVTLEESHHDIIQFTKTPIQKILKRRLHPDMAKTLRAQLGSEVLSRISIGPIICAYQKEKFKVKLKSGYLEPSLDRVFAFHINKNGLHTLSTFWEFENEIKSKNGILENKLKHLGDLLDFNQKLCGKFDLKTEPLDKYHRCTSIFLKRHK